MVAIPAIGECSAIDFMKIEPHFLLVFCLPLLPAWGAEKDVKVMMAKPTAEQTNFFENKVRPLLAENCFR